MEPNHVRYLAPSEGGEARQWLGIPLGAAHRVGGGDRTASIPRQGRLLPGAYLPATRATPAAARAI
jgi:hypothetical protein